MHKILITGITGFLGSHVAEVLIQNGFQVIGLKRLTSDTWRCKDFYEQINWINIDESNDWKQSIIQEEPDIIIHCAWIGVEARDRDNWSEQIKNIYFLVDLMEIAKSIHLNKFVFLGSQAEYGNSNGIISENEIPNALNAYGRIKLACHEIFKTFCELNDINWIWLRLFSIFGEKENENWLIPSLIKEMRHNQEMDFTPANQKYAYLYVKDFANIMLKILLGNVKSGIYNISSENAIQLKFLIEQIRDMVNPEFQLNFGALPYRQFQSMHIEGDMSKIRKQIGRLEFTDFNVALHNIIKYYTSK